MTTRTIATLIFCLLICQTGYGEECSEEGWKKVSENDVMILCVPDVQERPVKESKGISEGEANIKCAEGYNCIKDSCICIKSKRSEYIEKCEEYLRRTEESEKDSEEYIASLRSGINAQIATAYCTRALLEEK